MRRRVGKETRRVLSCLWDRRTLVSIGRSPDAAPDLRFGRKRLPRPSKARQVGLAATSTHPGGSKLSDAFTTEAFGRVRKNSEFLSPDVTSRLRQQLLDCRQPHKWYPVSRSIRRRVVYHAGPTNSGKTHTALEKLKLSQKGVYAAPLRLLAMEVYDALNRGGTYCNLVTGQERRYLPGAAVTSTTIEMVDCHTLYDVAVIDEIQMIGDKERASGWTRALHGLAARELHLCGDPSAKELVQALCREMQEEVEVVDYDRLSLLQTDDDIVESYDQVQPGDCVVAFSRAELFKIKQYIEYNTDFKVAIVYGALPPEVRQRQAELFNAPGNGYDILVATDAIGMGLNLNIRRIIFHSLQKTADREILPSQIKQISGRAGRHKSLYPVGRVTCRTSEDLERLGDALNLPIKALRTHQAGLYPESWHIALIAQQLGTEDLSLIFDKIQEEAILDDRYFLSEDAEIRQIAEAIRHVPLRLADRLSFCLAPVDVRDPTVMMALVEYATVFAKGNPVCCRLSLPNAPVLFVEQLKALQSAYQVASLWLWLSLRLNRRQFAVDRAVEAKLQLINEMFEAGLSNVAVTSQKRQASLPKRQKNVRQLLPCTTVDGL